MSQLLAIQVKRPSQKSSLLIGMRCDVMCNWRMKWREVDVVSRRDGGKLYFTEVKYCKNTVHGDGLAATTLRKQW
ncbi:YraN family protein [TM7 phylum sp. oral taxon 349]|nr:YraN family protein [TM7 phylum sp. oral taxon 349]